jgi:hypothetical protein
MKPVWQSDTPFQYYHRLSGSTSNTSNIAIDIDFGKRAWRMMELNATDTVNVWAALNSTVGTKGKGLAGLPSLPKFRPVSEKQIRNGTFTSIDAQNKHMYIPGLELAMANLDGFLSHCYVEPFLRVFDTSNQTAEQTKKMLDAQWDNKPNDRVLMRTAAFGHYRSKLSMCIKEIEDYNGMKDIDDHGDNKGIEDEMLVPFAIVAAMRKIVVELGTRDVTPCKSS